MEWIASYLALHAQALREGNFIELGVVLAKDVLICFSIASIAVIVERSITLRRVKQTEDRDYRSLREALWKKQSDAVRTLALASSAPSAVALGAGMSHGSEDQEIVREAIAQEVVVQTSELQSNLPILATVASTAPYIGLFGTVLGILDAFHTIAATGRTGASVVAGGISEALLATALGLGVAIPAVMAYNYFTGRVSNLSLLVETHAIDLASRLPALPPLESIERESIPAEAGEFHAPA
jgi:biopolymer transport protein ExbB